MDMSIVMNPIAMLFIAIAIGFVSVKTGYLEENMRKVISAVIVKITLPLLLFTSLLSKDLTSDTLSNAAIAAVAALVVVTALFALGYLTAKLFSIKEPTKTLHAVLSGSGNVVFLGYPLILSVFGNEALFYAVIYGLVNDALLWTAGVYFINRSSGQVMGKEAIKKLFNPNTIAFLIGLPLMFLGVKLPPLLEETLSGIGSLTTYLSMIFIGMTLATIDIKHLYKRVYMLPCALIKMVIAPILACLLFLKLGVSAVVMGAVVLEIAMPAQTIVTVIASDANSDERYAAEYVFFSTVLALITLPFVYYIMGRLVG